MNELILTEDETALVNLYRTMDIECRHVALAMCRAMAANGRFFARLEVMSNNQVGDNNIIQFGATSQRNAGSNGDD